MTSIWALSMDSIGISLAAWHERHKGCAARSLRFTAQVRCSGRMHWEHLANWALRPQLTHPSFCHGNKVTVSVRVGSQLIPARSDGMLLAPNSCTTASPNFLSVAVVPTTIEQVTTLLTDPSSGNASRSLSSVLCATVTSGLMGRNPRILGQADLS